MTDNDLNEQVNVTVDDASVITVPIDATLQNSNEAADAKAVGDALALKADKSELQAAVKVNNQPADAQGLILIDGRHIPVSDQDTETLANAVTDLKGKTAADIPMSSDSGAKTIAEVVNANSEAIEGMEEMTGATMPIESGSQTTVKAAIEARVKTVNRKAPDADGDVDLSVVPLAENLQSDKMESVEGSFIIRTTGGNASVSDGKAYPLHLFGSADHAGYVAEQLNMTVIPITRTEPDEPITATIDRDTFVAYVDESSTINLYYTTEWSADPELYGITVTGTPEAGDQITVVYVKEVRGTITVANPARLVGTGWNLFDYNNGYARVVKYSTEYGYKIGGSYASLQFSATLTGERSSITPGVDGLFNVPSDGYVFVTGGNNTDTYILTTWSDWMEGPSSGYWEPYRESGIDLSAVMTTYFPNGLLAVGATRDEIDLSAKRSISRIERMAYSEENRAAAAASGRSYDFDQNYIYIVRESAVISAITIDTTYNVSEHGLEWFTETTLPVISEILYGKNLRDKLERDVVTISAQTLTEEEKAQVRTNIGAMSQADGDKKLVAPTTAGTAGQLLHLKADGGTEWTTQGTPTDAQVGTAVSAWLTAHPEATTTVEDGAISRAKLNDDLKAKTDAVPDLKSAFTTLTFPVVPEMINGKLDSEGNAIDIGETDRWITLDYIPTEYLKNLENNTSGGKTYIDYYNYTDGSYVFTEYVTTNPGTVMNIDKTKGTHIRLYSTHASSGRNVVLNQYISTLKDIQDITALNAENIEKLDEESMIYRGVAPDNEQNLLSYLLDIGVYVTRGNQTWTDAPFEEVIALVNFQASNNYITQVAFTWNGEMAFRFVHKTNHTAYTDWNKIGRSAAVAPPHDGKYDVISVNHRGYNTVAPENTLPAYRLSAQHGFKFVETDIQLTKPGDDVLVCIHDSTINRTSDGTGSVNSFTYEQLLQYDFGSWKSATYAGTKIPTYEEFLDLCRNLGLYPYVELKQEFTKAQIQTILDITAKYGFTEDKISFVSAYYNDLVYVKDLNEKMRLGYIYNGDATAEKIAEAVALKSGINNVALLVDYKDLTNDGIQRCIAAKIPLEIWTADTETVIKGLDPYITGVTSNVLHAGEVLFNANKGDENGLIT